MDALYKLFVEDQVVVLKTHPGQCVSRAAPRRGVPATRRARFLPRRLWRCRRRRHLCSHSGVDEIHITGSDKTYEAIVFGPGEEGQRRKAANDPVVSKRLTAELGNVSGVIVVPRPVERGRPRLPCREPGDDAHQQRRFQLQRRPRDRAACRLAAAPGPAGQNPTGPWPGAGAQGLLSGRRRAIRILSRRPSGDRRNLRRPLGRQAPLGAHSRPRPAKKDDVCFTTEAFCGIFGETALEATTVPEYVDKAVAFCNGTLWGTLNVTLIVHPESLKDPDVARAVDRAIANLRYGTVSINHWGGGGLRPGRHALGWLSGRGAAGHQVRHRLGAQHADVRSHPENGGAGAVRVFPKPIWFSTHRTAHLLAPKLSQLEAAPSLAKLPGILALALRG